MATSDILSGEEKDKMQDKQFMRGNTDRKRPCLSSAGRMDRRTFLALCGAAGVATSAVIAGDAQAAADHVVMWNWGGQSEECHGAAIGEPFKAATGMDTKFDTSGPLEGKIKEMVDSGNVTADVADADLFNAVSLGADRASGADRLFDIVSKDKTLPQYALEYGVSVILYGYAFRL